MHRNCLIGLLLVAAIAANAHAADWLQFGYDQAHCGHNTAERGYLIGNTSNPAWSATVHAFGDGTAISSNSTPVFLSDVVTPSGTQDLLFLVTENGTLIAFSARDGSVVWSRRPPPKADTLTTGAAAIDPNRQFVYAYGLDGYVHKYRVGDGSEFTRNGWPALSTLKPNVEKGAAGIAISTPPGGISYLYHATNGYVGDNGDYQGHVTTVNLADATQVVFNSMCSNLFMHFVENGTARVNDCNLPPIAGEYAAGRMGGIWGRPGVVYDASTTRIYFATGNGLFDANMASDYEWGDTVLSLHPDGTGSGMGMPVDSYTPQNYANLDGRDIDLGSTAPAILPSLHVTYPHLAIQSGKDGCVRLLNLDNMSGAGGPGHAGGELNAATSCTTDSIWTQTGGGGEVLAQPAVWVDPTDGATWAYVAMGGLVAYKLDVSGATPALVKQWTICCAQTSAVIANGVLYAASTGIVRGFNPITGNQVWSASIGGIYWQSVIVVNGHLYVADTSAKLWSFPLDGIFKNGYQ